MNRISDDHEKSMNKALRWTHTVINLSRFANNADLRGSFYGVDDAKEQAKQQKSSKHARFKLSPVKSPRSSIEEPRTARKEPGTFAIDFDSDNTR